MSGFVTVVLDLLSDWSVGFYPRSQGDGFYFCMPGFVTVLLEIVMPGFITVVRDLLSGWI